jgi:hypothetical protein
LLIVNDATGTEPHASTHAFRAAQLLDEPLRAVCRLGVVPELGGPDHLGAVVEGDEAVLLGGDGHRDDRRAPARRRASTSASRQTPVPARCGAGT